MRARLGMVAASLALAAGCSDGVQQTATAVVLQIEAGDAATSGIDRIDLLVSTALSAFTTVLRKQSGDASFRLPFGTRVSIPNGATGTVLLRATVFSGAGAYLSEGRTQAMIVPNETITLVLRLGENGPGIHGSRLTISPNVQEFEPTTIGGRSAPTTFTVTNAGNAATGALDIALPGSDFKVVAGGCAGAPLAAGGSCQITVRFSPTSSGPSTGSLVVTVAGSAESVSATLMGSGITAAALNVTPGPVDLGTAVLGTADTSANFTVTNTGMAPTGTLVTALAGANPTQFPIVAGGDGCTGFSLTGGASCTVAVSFAPTEAGAQSATLTVSGSPGGSTQVSMVGTGAPPAAFEIAPDGQDFGTVAAGTVSGDVDFVVRNTGGTTTGAITASLSGPGVNNFRLVRDGCAAALGPQATCTLTVRFAPTSVGVKWGTLRVAGGSSGNFYEIHGRSAVSLTGFAITPAALEIAPTPQDFGSVVVGQATSVIPFTVSNSGAAPSGPLQVSASGTDFSLVTGLAGDCVAGTTTLAPGTSCVLRVRFSPVAAAGPKISTLMVAAIPGGVATASLTGTALPLLTVEPAEFSFDAAPIGITAGSAQTATFVVTNNASAPGPGTGPLTLSSGLDFPIADGSRFTSACVSGVTRLPAGGTCSVVVRFTPTAVGRFSAELDVKTIGSGGAAVRMTGVGNSALTVVPTRADYHSVAIGGFLDLPLMITNDPRVSPISSTLASAISGDTTHFLIVSDRCAGFPLAPGSSCEITVRFLSEAPPGDKAAKLTVSRPGAPNIVACDLLGGSS